MKKIKKLFHMIAAKVNVGDSFKSFAFLAIALILSSTASALTNYCGTVRSSTSPTTAYTLNYTCKNVSGTTYQMILDFPSTVTSADNINIGANPGPTNVGASPVFSNGNKTLTLQFTTATTPTLYVGIIFVTISGVSVRWDLPLDANFATTCPAAAPSLTTTAATAITGTTATLNGNISNNGGAAITDYGFYWSTTNGFANGAGTQIQLGTTNFTGNITSNLTSLTYSTPYYYKAYATNSLGTTYGTQQTFTTIAQFPPPTLGSPTATAITNNSATLGATILTVGSPIYTARGTSYKTTTGVVVTDNQLSDGTNTGATGAYSHSRTGLSPQQQYFYVGYGTNTTGSGISSEGTFITLSNPPTAQPTTFTTTAGVLSLVANWNAATFPVSGATKAGYIVIYSTATPTLSSANGNAPTAGVGTLVNVGNTTLPAAPALTTTLSSVTAGATYNLLIVPYTWDGTNNATYNYLTSGAITTTGIPLDIAAAPTPPARTATNVVSIYSDAYTVGVTSPAYGSSSAATPGGNAARLYTSSNNGVLSFASTTAIASGAMTTLHMDIYSTTSQAAQMLIQINGVNSANKLTPNGVWTSLDIPSTAWAAGFGTTLSSIGILPYAGSGTFYVDNVYFYKGGPPTISNFPAMAKVNGAADFNLTQPTSNSPGTWTYSSNTPGVATVSGTTVHITGVGTATITATQAASGLFDAGSITAILTVTASTTPTAGPTAPPARNSWDVISVFSDAAYTAAPGTRGYNPGWGQAGSASVVSVAGDNAWRATNLNYQGLDFGANVDVSAMTTFHVDVWTFDETSLQFYQINNGGGERSYTLTPLVQGQWNSYDIPLTAWTSQSGFLVNNLFQFKVVGSGGKTVYFDNMYFYRAATTLPPTLSAFTVPSKVVGDTPFALTAPTSNNNPATFTYTSSNTNVATISGSTVTVLAPGTTTITATQTASGGYGTNTITATLTVTPPAAPTPTARNTWDVISLYSDSYATSSSPSLGGFGTGVTLPGSNNARFLSSGALYRLAFSSTDVSAMTTLHIDVYALDQSSWQFRLNDKVVTKSTPVNGWTSVDILLSDYVSSGLNLSTVSYFDFFNPNGANPNSSYLDNIYFYRAATLPPATVGTFTVPAKVLGDAPFTLTPPTSDNTSPFTYSSSDTSIATISGSTLTVVGGGTATITASQVADGTFGPTSKTASLVVTYPAPGPSPVPPVRDAARVVSMFTGTPPVYANAITAVRSSWTAGTTMTTIPNGTNTCLQLDNLGFLGLVASSGTFSAVGMTNLHVDVYLNSPISNMFVVLVSTAADKLYNTGALVAGWNSLNINLATAYPGAPLGTIYGLKFEQNVGVARQIYLDNVYFSNDYYTFYADADGDGYGDAASSISATSAPTGYVSNNTDCDVNDPTVWRTGTFYVDFDGDGYNYDNSPDPSVVTLCYGDSVASYYIPTTLGVDCDDTDPAIHSPATPSVVLTSSDADNSFCTGTSVTFTATASNVSGPATTGDAVVTYTFKVNGSSVQSSTDNTYTTTTLTTGQTVTVVIDITGGTCRTSDTASSTGITNTVNPLPTVTAGNVSGCAGSAITLIGLPSGGTFSIANPYTGPSTTYTYSYTNNNGCSATSASATVTITAQPLWYLDADNDGYYTGTSVASCTSPGAGYTTATLFGGGDCNDAVAAINPGATEICYNNIDDNCNGIKSESCAPVVVNMTPSYNNTTLVSLSTAIPAVGYTYPGTSNIKYRFSIKNVTTNTTAADILQDSRYVTIPAALHLYGATYTIKVSAVINDEVVPFYGNTITVTGPTVQLITLSSASCGTTLASLSSTISSNGGLNATGYTFRIRMTSDSGPTPNYGYSSSATRFVGANSFTGFPLQYNTSYQVAVKYTYTDPLTSLPVESAYGAECSVTTPSIPLIGLAAPTCGSQVATLNAGITASPAAYATGYRFRIRLTSDNGPTPTYYYSLPNASRFSSLVAFQGITFAYNTQYSIAVEYSILTNSVTQWSGFGSECVVQTPFFPTTSLVPSQCGLATATSLTQQLNITPYPGFPNYKVKLDEISGESITNTQEIVITYSNFRLNQFSIAQLGKNYNVSVAIKLNGVFGDYSTACDLFTATPARTVKLPFKAAAYPNPFANNFMLDVTTSSKSVVGVKVYDMVGRLIEQRQVNASDLENATIGDSYPSGIYNVVVSQEDSIETVRVIKR